MREQQDDPLPAPCAKVETAWVAGVPLSITRIDVPLVRPFSWHFAHFHTLIHVFQASMVDFCPCTLYNI